MTLVEFLTARLDEDESRAKSPHLPYTAHWPECDYPGDMPGVCTCDLPVRVLREVEAKRALIDDLGDAYERGWPSPDEDHYVAADVLGHLAAVYADHPDYDEAWQPS